MMLKSCSTKNLEKNVLPEYGPAFKMVDNRDRERCNLTVLLALAILYVFVLLLDDRNLSASIRL